MAKEPKWEVIDVDALSECLAQDAWAEEVKHTDIPEDDLWENIPVYGTYPVEYEKQVRSKWAHLWFDLKNTYDELIMKFRK